MRVITLYAYCVFFDIDQNSNCTDDFLSEQTLQSIVQNSLQSDKAPMFDELNDTQSNRLHIIPDMTLTSTGLLTKWTFAAKFNHNIDGEAESSWPELQIWRKSRESGNQYTKISGSSMEPRPTGYLNVFEYDLSEHPVEVKAGDVLGVYQPGLEDAQYTLGFVAAGNSIDAPTNYIVHDVDSSKQNFNIVDKHEERSLLPLVFAQIQGNRNSINK